MKRFLMMGMAVALMTACEHPMMDAGVSDTAVVTFSVQGSGFGSFTRAVGIAESDMTDMWVFDYLDGELVRQVVQNSGDEGFGVVSMPLEYGQHVLCFVASRGTSPSLDVSNGVISWESPRDTYWQKKSVTVSSGVAGEQSVTLQRVATRLRLTVTDEVPDGLSKVDVKLSKWYRGLDWQTGLAELEQERTTTIAVPSSYAGTAGDLVMNVFSISDAFEWTADVEITARDGSGGVMGYATIAGAPFVANRTSDYSGRLFTSNTQAGITLDDEWASSFVGTW